MSTSSKKLSTKGQGCSSFSTNENQVLKCVKKQNKNCFFHKPSSHQIIIGTIHTLFYTGEKNEFMSHGYDLPQQKHMPPLNPRMIFSVAVENRWRRFHPTSTVGSKFKQQNLGWESPPKIGYPGWLLTSLTGNILTDTIYAMMKWHWNI